MRVLLDECLPKKLKAHIVADLVQTVPEAGWAGTQNGELLRLAEQEFDVPVGDGWTNAVQGYTCHDVRTGEMVYINYTTRWLYTGQYEGQNYERAYFGDYETLEQYLVDTNAELSFIE